MTYSLTLYFSDDVVPKVMKKFGSTEAFRDKLKEKALEMIS